MNISLTFFCVIGIALAMATAILALDDIEDGVVFPWQLIASFMIGLCITHGQFLGPVYTWMIAHLGGDGLAGAAMSALTAISAEAGMAGLPTLAGAGVYVVLARLDKDRPPPHGSQRTRRGLVVHFLRKFAIR